MRVAGHPAPLRCAHGKTDVPRRGGGPAAGRRSAGRRRPRRSQMAAGWPETVVSLDPGSSLLLYTDGLLDAYAAGAGRQQPRHRGVGHGGDLLRGRRRHRRAHGSRPSSTARRTRPRRHRRRRDHDQLCGVSRPIGARLIARRVCAPRVHRCARGRAAPGGCDLPGAFALVFLPLRSSSRLSCRSCRFSARQRRRVPVGPGDAAQPGAARRT